MPDQRETLRRSVYMNLRSAKFRRLLPAQTEEGFRPLIIALHDDKAQDVLGEIVAAGGLANVIVGDADGMLIATFAVQHGDHGGGPDGAVVYLVSAEETIGEFLGRVELSDEAAQLADALQVGLSVRVPAFA